MIEWFDELSKGLAGGQSRRGALRFLGRGAMGAALVSLLPGRVLADDGGNSDCAHFCNDVFPPGPERGQCTSDAAHGQGPCPTCGPAAATGHPAVCRTGTSGAICCPTNAPNCCGNTTCVNL